MAVGGGAFINRLIQIEMRADAARRQIHQLLQDSGKLLLVRGSRGIDIERQRFGDTDRIGDLDRAALGEPGGDDVLGEVTRIATAKTKIGLANLVYNIKRLLFLRRIAAS